MRTFQLLLRCHPIDGGAEEIKDAATEAGRKCRRDDGAKSAEKSKQTVGVGARAPRRLPLQQAVKPQQHTTPRLLHQRTLVLLAIVGIQTTFWTL